MKEKLINHKSTWNIVAYTTRAITASIAFVALRGWREDGQRLYWAAAMENVKILKTVLCVSDSRWNTLCSACDLVHGDANFIAQHLHKTAHAKWCEKLLSSYQQPTIRVTSVCIRILIVCLHLFLSQSVYLGGGGGGRDLCDWKAVCFNQIMHVPTLWFVFSINSTTRQFALCLEDSAMQESQGRKPLSCNNARKFSFIK